jgi:type II secretory pathway component GspD/PulD (secretin)
MHHHVFMFGMARRTCVAASLLLTALCAPNSGLNAAESVEPVTPTSQRVEADEASREQILATADDLQAHGKTTEALALLADFVKNHPRDQVAKAHLLDLRVKQKENEIRATLQEQSDNQDLILSDPEYQTLAARAHEDIRKRLAVVEYFLGQNRLNEAAQGCNTILRDYPHDPAAMRLKFRILNTVAERERQELLKDREYRRSEAVNDVIEDSIFPRDKQRSQRQVFVFQEDIDDLERTRVRERLQEKISLNQDQAKVWDVMRTLFAVAGINYVVLDSAVGEETVSLHLVDDTVESALSVIGKLAKVRFSYTDGTVFVSSDADDGLVTEIIRLRSGLTNVEADVKGSSFSSEGGSGGGGMNGGDNSNLPPQVQQALRNQQQAQGRNGANGSKSANGGNSASGANGGQTDLEKFLESLPNIIVGWQDTHKWHLDRKSNTLYLRANPWVISEVKRLLHALDYNNVQVLIESRFVEVTEKAMRKIGVEWGAYQGSNPANPSWAGGNGMPMTPAKAITGAGTGGILSGLLQTDSFTLSATLKALEEENQADSLAEPKILTLNNATGLIEIAKNYTYIETYNVQTYSDSQTVSNGNVTSNSRAVATPQWQTEDIGYQLKITPSIARNSDVITLKLLPTVRQLINENVIINGFEYVDQGVPIKKNVSKPVFSKRTLETVLHVQNGRTVALGGLADEQQSISSAGTPFVSKIPVLGWLFKSEERKTERKNLIILVTANLVEPSGSKVGDDITHLRDTARILMPEGVVQGMEPDKPVMIEPSQPAGPVAQPNPLMNKGRRP